MKPLNTTVEQVLIDAIQSEVNTRVYYQKLAARAATADVRKRLLDLSDQELVHRAKLERRYMEEFHKLPPDPKVVEIDIPADIVALDMNRSLKIALDHERESESNFRFLAERVPDTKLGNLFMELAEIEWKHKVDLQNEYDVTAADPEQFLLDI